MLPVLALGCGSADPRQKQDKGKSFFVCSLPVHVPSPHALKAPHKSSGAACLVPEMEKPSIPKERRLFTF
jgi:hypothetical protein